ncbi:hypothetical protein ALI22I_37390 [Saccharothrix sp. ALI-22-I]|uniref:DUF4244 domain-containing protein n=1 Tax=Saccharothrix sp. ALI-22-I TaxID=1933778 RepID=UPI00097BAB43|nr:DUF4244 domain-containing protein [Saccharothrix sp. ALI-22-I]ONI81872.1 hypothetical protein ALI22I_37390 [Saccharothrix sp. ALI-22-I]
MSQSREKVLDDSGTSTVEYAIASIAAAGLAMLLYSLLTGDWTLNHLQGLLQRAFTVDA